MDCCEFKPYGTARRVNLRWKGLIVPLTVWSVLLLHYFWISYKKGLEKMLTYKTVLPVWLGKRQTSKISKN